MVPHCLRLWHYVSAARLDDLADLSVKAEAVYPPWRRRSAAGNPPAITTRRFKAAGEGPERRRPKGMVVAGVEFRRRASGEELV
jgi:hypothetical protein